MKSTGSKSLLISTLSFLAWINAVSSYEYKQEKSWTYDLTSVESDSSNEDMINYKLEVERVSRGVYAMSGKFTLNYDIVNGDNNEAEVTSYRSDTANGNYKLLPFAIPRQHIFSFINTFYKDMAMDSLKDCSDMPQFKGEFVPPLEKKTYTMTKCQISQDGYPQYLQDGFYKVIFKGYGTVDWSVTVFVEVQQRT